MKSICPDSKNTPIQTDELYCIYCNMNKMSLIRKDINIANHRGMRTIHSLVIFKCNNCGETLYPQESVDRIKNAISLLY